MIAPIVCQWCQAGLPRVKIEVGWVHEDPTAGPCGHRGCADQADPPTAIISAAVEALATHRYGAEWPDGFQPGYVTFTRRNLRAECEAVVSAVAASLAAEPTRPDDRLDTMPAIRLHNWCLATHGHEMQMNNEGNYVAYDQYKALRDEAELLLARVREFERVEALRV